jgi:hypothetical protein
VSKNSQCINFSLYLIHISNTIISTEAEKSNGWAAMLGIVAAFLHMKRQVKSYTEFSNGAQSILALSTIFS